MKELEHITYFIEKVPDLFEDIYHITFQKGNSRIHEPLEAFGIGGVRTLILNSYKNSKDSPKGVRPLKINLNGLSSDEQFIGLEDWVKEEIKNLDNGKNGRH